MINLKLLNHFGILKKITLEKYLLDFVIDAEYIFSVL